MTDDQRRRPHTPAGFRTRVCVGAATALPPPAGPPNPSLMQRQHRLTGDAQITRIHRQGRSAANRLLVFRLLPNDLERSRFCIVAAKRVGNAVVRNRVKRRLRAAVRSAPCRPGWDTIIMARRGAGEADYHRLEQAVRNLMRRTGLAVPSPATKSDSATEPQSAAASAPAANAKAAE